MTEEMVKYGEDKVQYNREKTFLTTIERLASNPDVDVAKIKQFMEMEEHILDRNAKQAFNAAMVMAQGRMEVVLKKAKSEHGRFADLEAVLEMARPIYTSEGFAVTFYEGFSTVEKPLKDGFIRMMADIMHSQGHTKTVTADIPIDDKGPQGKTNKSGPHATGSSFSYGRRYLNCMIWNIATGDDDDGNAACGIQYITPEMQTEINDLIKSTKADKAKVLKYLKSESVEKILLSDYGKAKVAFESKAKAEKKPEREPGSDDK